MVECLDPVATASGSDVTNRARAYLRQLNELHQHPQLILFDKQLSES